LGIPDSLDFCPVLLTMGRRNLSSSGLGGTRETREMLDFAASITLLLMLKSSRQLRLMKRLSG
jgi:D-arabinose 1-dehydrogenase-like Zn-dependent alcohol dehydrogenase